VPCTADDCVAGGCGADEDAAEGAGVATGCEADEDVAGVADGAGVAGAVGVAGKSVMRVSRYEARESTTVPVQKGNGHDASF